MSRLHVRGVPLHPALVHFPLAFWVAAVALECAALLGAPGCWEAMRWTLAAGCVTAVPAMGAGLVDFPARAAPGAARTAFRHALLMSSAWCLFTVLALLAPARPPAPGWLAGTHLAGMLAGLALLLAGGHAGGRLVYVYGTGLAPEGSRPAP